MEEDSTTKESHNMPRPTSFNFITFSDVDHMRNPAALSRIRRHAMKDIGLQRRKPKKRRRIEIELHVPSELNFLKPAIGGGSMHTFFHIPVELDDIGRSLLANMWRDEGESKQQAHRKDWFSVGLADPATFNQCLANSELHLEALRHPHRKPRETPLSIYYHQLALKTLRKQLEEGEVTDGTIGTITGMVVYAEISGIFDNWLPQRKGLIDVINARQGGLDAIESNVHLRATASWVEIRGAYMQDLPTLLPSPKAWLDIESNYRFEDDSTNASLLPSASIICTDLMQIVESLSSLGSQISINLSKIRTEETFETELLAWTNVIAHRLLSMRPLEMVEVEDDNSGEQKVREAVRLALLLFIAPIYRAYGASPIDTTVHQKKLQGMLLSIPKSAWKDCKILRIWILCICAFEVTNISVREWFLHRLPVQVPWDSLQQSLWIPELFDEKMAALQFTLAMGVPENRSRGDTGS